MSLPGPRAVNFGGFLVCAALMGFALYAQYVLSLEPCPLCVLQRIAVISLGVVFLAAAMHDPPGRGRYVYSALAIVAAAAGATVAGRHMWLQSLPEDKVPACGPGLDYMLESFPLRQVFEMVFTGSGECAEISWQFLGLSMPAWVLVWVLLLGTVAAWNNLRARR